MHAFTFPTSGMSYMGVCSNQSSLGLLRIIYKKVRTKRCTFTQKYWMTVKILLVAIKLLLYKALDTYISRFSGGSSILWRLGSASWSGSWFGSFVWSGSRTPGARLGFRPWAGPGRRFGLASAWCAGFGAGTGPRPGTGVGPWPGSAVARSATGTGTAPAPGLAVPPAPRTTAKKEKKS